MAPVHVKGMAMADAVSLSMELLDKVGLADFAEAYPTRLSGGQQ